MKTLVMTGKTVDDALEAALNELGANKDDVDVKVIEEGSKGFLGIGNKEAKIEVTLKNNPKVIAVSFLEGLFKTWGEDVSVCAEMKDDVLYVELKGENMGIIIGKRGETLDAIQHLTSLNVNNNSDDFVKVSVDTENYREKRNQTLAELSKKLAVRVAKTRKNLTLEPMNSYERRIIHATLQDDKYVTTYSVGQSPNRKVVIAYNKK
ncbi:MAG: protein jag [Ruminococcaceae bacterium]|nr:protein jag [Oscillospiraceae bacterium]